MNKLRKCKRSYVLIILFSNFQGSIRYEVTGDVPAPNYFEVNEESGAISVKADLKTDDEMEYKVIRSIPYKIYKHPLEGSDVWPFIKWY